MQESLEQSQVEKDALQAACEQLEDRCNRLETEVVQVGKDVELECYRAVELEHRKWEAREERLLQKADRHGRHRQQGDSNSESGADSESPPTVQTGGDVSVQGNAHFALASGDSRKGEQPNKGGVGTVEAGPKTQSESPPLLQACRTDASTSQVLMRGSGRSRRNLSRLD